MSGAPVFGDPGYKEYFSRRANPQAVMFELRRISSVYTHTRDTALERMRAQARECGAHAVIAVELALGEDETEEGPTIEYVALGTAIQLPDQPQSDAPHLTVLSAADYWNLRTGGYTAIGIAAATSVFYVRPSPATVAARSGRWRAAAPNQELSDFSIAISRARDVCNQRMRAQAEKVAGGGIIGMSLQMTHHVGAGLTSHGEGRGRSRYGNLHLNVHALGTVIAPLERTRPHKHLAAQRTVLWLHDQSH